MVKFYLFVLLLITFNLVVMSHKLIYNFGGGKKVKERKTENLQTYDETHDELVR